MFAIGVAPKLGKGKAPQLFEEQRIGSGPGDAKREPAPVVEIEHERVGQHAADRAGSTSFRSGALRAPRSFIQYA